MRLNYFSRSPFSGHITPNRVNSLYKPSVSFNNKRFYYSIYGRGYVHYISKYNYYQIGFSYAEFINITLDRTSGRLYFYNLLKSKQLDYKKLYITHLYSHYIIHTLSQEYYMGCMDNYKWRYWLYDYFLKTTPIKYINDSNYETIFIILEPYKDPSQKEGRYIPDPCCWDRKDKSIWVSDPNWGPVNKYWRCN